MYSVKTPDGAILTFPTQAAVLRHLGTKNRFNLWRHLKRDEAEPGSRFKTNTFFGHVVTKVPG